MKLHMYIFYSPFDTPLIPFASPKKVSWEDDSKETVGYEISYASQGKSEEKEAKSREWQVIEQNASKEKRLTLSNLQKQTRYTVRIRGKNSKHLFGVYSKPSYFTTLKKPELPVLVWNTLCHGPNFTFSKDSSSYEKKNKLCGENPMLAYRAYSEYEWIACTYVIKASEWEVFYWEFSFSFVFCFF